MISIANIMQESINTEKWKRFYQEIKTGNISETSMVKLELWHLEVSYWCDKIEQEMRYKDLVKIVQNIVKDAKEQKDAMLHLYSHNNNVQTGWYPLINKRKIDYAIETEKSYCGVRIYVLLRN